MAEIVPFPLARRADLVRRQAALFAGLGQRAAENGLCHMLEIQRRVLLRRGIDDREADRQVLALEGAIRAHVWRLILVPGDAG